MKSFLKNNISDHFLKVLGLFLVWRFLLVIFLLIAINFIPLHFTDKFLGGGPTNYHLSPYLFSWANFDGEHYLSISIFGYKNLEQAFFPVYPALISFFAEPLSKDIFSALMFSTLVGIIISNLSFILALLLLFELVLMDFSRKIAYSTIILILIFPTSFYFGSVYNESLFLLLTVGSFYAARKQKWWIAGILGALSSATRVFGVLLLPALIIEAWQQKGSKKDFLWLLLVPIGLLSYMAYQWVTVGDPITFYRLQKIVGEQHQSGITLLPQVLFRYIKMLIAVDFNNPIYQTILLEFIVGIAFFLLPIYGYFKKIRLSYLFFALFGFLTPSIQGSLSSVPRYILIFFPSFIALTILINSFPKWVKVFVLSVLFFWLAVETMLFLRGYWIA
ncbi:hypothetical protein C4577_00945 [Candidatus Parcubacteria bacterium]|nr:MAG: hypothetical protein C4577_00945 [Candidatus Parcubacteria bacterium]